MAGLNDVVRHVILRISVDQAGLAEELAAARAKLKALKDGEREVNKDRVKSSETVTRALEAQNKELEKNREAHEAAARAASSRGKEAAENVKAETDALKENTGERRRQTVEEARADAIRQKADTDAQKSAQSLAAARQKADDAATARAAKLNADQVRYAAEEQRRDAAAYDRRRRDTTSFLQDERRKQDAVDETVRRKNDESDARVRSTDARTASTTIRNDDTRRILDDTHDDRREATRTQAQSATAVAQERTAAAQSASELASYRAMAAEQDKIAAATSRRNRSLRETHQISNDIRKGQQESRLLEEKIAAVTENRARAAERAARVEASQRRRQTGALGAIGNVLADTAVLAGRSILTAPRAARQAAAAYDPKSLDEQERRITKFSGRVERTLSDLGRKFDNSKVGAGFLAGFVRPLEKVEAASKRVFTKLGGDAESSGGRVARIFRSAEASADKFFRAIPRGGEDAARAFGRVSAAVRGFAADLNVPRLGGSGGNFFKNFANNIETAVTRVGSAFSGMGNHIISFQNLVFAIIAALGPLAAILGAVGAAALGLASNLGALVGVLGALPGLITSAVAGFGALAVVMRPLSNLMSAYKSAQTEAMGTTNAAATAALNLKEALLQQTEAQLALARAQKDVPRAQTALNNARQQATRDIEDYRDALKKLKYDEEGARLGVESAQQDYRKAIFDPTATKLDVDIAKHNLQGSYFDQNDQQKNAKRTIEDATQAFDKGVEGADAVVDALRRVQDLQNNITESELAYQKAVLAAEKAKKESDAGGGPAAATYKAQLAKLSPATREVVLAVIALKGEYKKLQDQLSTDIFGPVSTETGKFKDVLKELGDFLKPAASAIGFFARNALNLFTNPDWKAFFTSQGKEAGRTIGLLGDALLSTADAFRNIITVAKPFTDFVVDGIVGMAKSFDSFTTSKRGQDQLTWFFDNTKKRMQELGPIVGNFFSGLFGFFKALNQSGGAGKDDFTTYFNKGLRNASESFKKLGQQAQDPNGGFQKWLRDVRPLLHDIVGFLSSAGRFFGQLFSDPRNLAEAERILKELATKWLPKLAEIFSRLSESGVISKIAKVLGGTFGFLQTAAGWLDKFGAAIDWLNQKFPGLKNALEGIGITLGVVFGAALVVKLLRIVEIFKGLASLIRGTGNVIGSVQTSGGVKNATKNYIDTKKDNIFGRDQGTSAARRQIRDEQRGKTTPENSAAAVRAALGRPDPVTKKPGILSRIFGRKPNSTTDETNPASTKPGVLGRIVQGITTQPTIDPTNTGGVLPTLYRIENYAKEIAANTRRGTGGSSGGRGGSGGSGPSGGSTGPRGTSPSSGVDDANLGPSERRRRRAGIVPSDYTTSVKPSNDGRFITPTSFGPDSVLDQPLVPSGQQTAKQREREAQAVRQATNSPTGIADRRQAVLEARKRRLAQEFSTGLGATEDEAARQIAANGPSTPSTRYESRNAPIPQPMPGRPPESISAPPNRRALTPPGPLVNGVIEPTLPSSGPRTPRRELTTNPSVIEGDFTENPQALVPSSSARRDRTTAVVPTGGSGLTPAEEEALRRRQQQPFALDPAPAAAVKPRKPDKFSRRKLTSGPSLADVGEDLSVYTGLDDAPETYTKPAQRRNASGQFVKPDAPTRTTTQPRSTSGRFGTKTGVVEPDLTPPRTTLFDVDEPHPKPTTPRRKTSTRGKGKGSGFIQGALDLFGNAVGNDSGYLDLGIGSRSAREPDLDVLSDVIHGGDGTGSSSGRRPKRSVRSRLGKFGKGLLGGLVTVGAALGGSVPTPTVTGTTPIAGAANAGEDEFDDGYDKGYDDALSGSGQNSDDQGLQLPDFDTDSDEEDGKPKQTRKERRQARKEARQQARTARRERTTSPGRGGRLGRLFNRGTSSVVSDLEGAVENTATGPGKRGLLSRLFNRGGTTAAVEGVESVAKGGLLRGVGGGLLRGVGGGLVGAALSGAVSLGGDYLTNKFVKNADDRSSLSRGLGAVANGAGIGATIGSIIPGVGTVVGGAIGGIAGGAYSLFKDKNLRNFVGGKLSSAAKGVGNFVGDIAGDVGGAVSGAAKGVGHFFGGLGGDVKSLFSGKDSGVGGAAALALGPIGLALSKTDIGKSIIESLNKAGSTIGKFFTKTIPDFFNKGIHGITNFFTVTLPSLPGRAFDAFFRGIGRMIRFFTTDLPHAAGKAFDAFFIGVGRTIRFFTTDLPRAAEKAWHGITTFFTKTLPNAAAAAWTGITGFFTETLPGLASQAWGFVKSNLWEPFLGFVKAIPGFFTQTIPHWFEAVVGWERTHIIDPLRNFITKTIPEFFTQTIPHWFEAAPAWFKTHVIDPITDFFTNKIPGFFTETLPNAIKSLPGVVYNNLVQPVLDFFKGLAGHVGDFLKGGWDWAKGLFTRAGNDIKQGEQGKMSGGLVAGVYQGIEDTASYRLTPEEFVVRRSKVMQPGGKAFLNDFNEGRITPDMFFGGLSATVKPQVMSIVPPDSAALTGALSKIQNTTINHAPIMGDVTIHNPIREKSESSLRRRIQIANIRHRRGS